MSSTAVFSSAAELADALDATLPQTQCTRCGYPDCRRYAEAIAAGQAQVNQCPPGGEEGVARLARISGRPMLPLDPAHGLEGPLRRAVVNEDWCIGCTLCIKACPVDCIVGAPKQMHTVIESLCTGCELCLPACPVDCISLVNASGERQGWAAWSAEQADEARHRYTAHRTRLAREADDQRARSVAKAEAKLADLPAASRITDPDELQTKRSIIEAALARARAQRPR